MKKHKGFLRLTLVLSILAAIIALFCEREIANANVRACQCFIAIWIAYAIARWIIPPIVKWIIAGFKDK